MIKPNCFDAAVILRARFTATSICPALAAPLCGLVIFTTGGAPCAKSAPAEAGGVNGVSSPFNTRAIRPG
jgi:hypothetical protein